MLPGTCPGLSIRYLPVKKLRSLPKASSAKCELMILQHGGFHRNGRHFPGEPGGTRSSGLDWAGLGSGIGKPEAKIFPGGTPGNRLLSGASVWDDRTPTVSRVFQEYLNVDFSSSNIKFLFN